MFLWALHINSVTVCAYKLCAFGLQDIQLVKTPEELENFMLKHGENIIDTLGAEVDRLEKELKVSEKTTLKFLIDVYGSMKNLLYKRMEKHSFKYFPH